MVVREKNCYYAIALTDFFVFLSCAEQYIIKNVSAHDRNTKLNLANAYQIKNEAID